MPDTPNGWGKIVVGARLEKAVVDDFFTVWTELIMKGLRKGDGVLVAKKLVAHRAANYLVRRFLQIGADTLCFLDSDAEVDPGFLSAFRDYEPGWEYDALQAFYPRRGWPPEAIWYKSTPDGGTMQCMVVEDNAIEDVAGVGLHCTLIRREVFLGLLGDNDPAKHDWFYYPRHKRMSEDMAFSADALAAGFRIGATTAIKTGHISQITIGWETYQEYLTLSGQRQRTERFLENAKLIASYLGEEVDEVMRKAIQGEAAPYPAPTPGEAWRKASPQTPDQVRQFYGGRESGYLYDLLRWNATPFYDRILAEIKKKVKSSRVLVIGAGLGNEVETLNSNWNEVEAFELPGALRGFLEQRFEQYPGPLYFVDWAKFSPGTAPVGRYDWIVLVDVIEHVHPAEIEAFLTACGLATVQGGQFFIHVNFRQQDIYPMHYDHSEVFDLWTSEMDREGEFIWRKKLSA